MPRQLTLFFAQDFLDKNWAGHHHLLECHSERSDRGHRGEWILGRHPAADLTISIQNVSRQHAAINYSYGADRWFVTDLGSTSGTSLSGQILPPHDPAPIQPGDRLWLGGNLIYVVGDLDDTIGRDEDDDGPSTIADIKPLATIPPEPPPLPALPPASRSQWDVVAAAIDWMMAPSSRVGAVVRLALVALAALVAVLIFD